MCVCFSVLFFTFLPRGVEKVFTCETKSTRCSEISFPPTFLVPKGNVCVCMPSYRVCVLFLWGAFQILKIESSSSSFPPCTSVEAVCNVHGVCVCVSFELVFPQQRHTQVAILFFYFFFPVSTLQRHYNVAQSGTLRTTHEMNVSWKFDSRANVIAVIKEKKKNGRVKRPASSSFNKNTHILSRLF